MNNAILGRNDIYDNKENFTPLDFEFQNNVSVRINSSIMYFKEILTFFTGA